MIEEERFHDLDSSLFKAFLFAARELNFTRAAEKAAMTQAGVSQKIAKLERQLGHPLFLRVNKSVFLTDAGHVLLDFIERQQDEIEGLFDRLGIALKAARGSVRYAMPHSCLFTPHFSRLLEARHGFSAVNLKVTLCSNEDVVRMLLDFEIDFGFLTRRSSKPGIVQKPFALEDYVLVGGQGLVGRLRPNFANLQYMPFVSYPGMQSLFEIWKAARAPRRRSLNFEALVIAGEINSLHGAVTMLTHGVGLSVVPRHVVAGELKQGELTDVFADAAKPIRSEIFIASLVGAHPSARVQAVLDAFWSMKTRD